MTFFNLLLLFLLLLQPLSAMSNFVSPLADDVCKEVKCGKGSCKATTNGSLLFECECDAGWKQTRLGADGSYNFLPCIVPNCSLNNSCSKTSSSAQEKTRTAIASIFNPCQWVDCKDGSCNKTSALSYSCNCDAGYSNLFNSTAFPCFKECAIGLECSNLGISLKNSSSTSAPPASNSNDGGSILKGMSLWVLMLIIWTMIHLNQID